MHRGAYWCRNAVPTRYGAALGPVDPDASRPALRRHAAGRSAPRRPVRAPMRGPSRSALRRHAATRARVPRLRRGSRSEVRPQALTRMREAQPAPQRSAGILAAANSSAGAP